jgi:hypothetical protein
VRDELPVLDTVDDGFVAGFGRRGGRREHDRRGDDGTARDCIDDAEREGARDRLTGANRRSSVVLPAPSDDGGRQAVHERVRRVRGEVARAGRASSN